MALLPRFAFALRGEGPIQLPLNDRWRSYRIDEALQWLKSPMHYISQIFMPRDFRPKTTLRPWVRMLWRVLPSIIQAHFAAHRHTARRSVNPTCIRHPNKLVLDS